MDGREPGLPLLLGRVHGAGSDTTEFVNLIDLKTFKNTRFEVTLNDPAEDLHPFLGGRPQGGRPRTLFLATGGQVQAFRVADVLNGLPNTPTSTIGIGAGSHGQFISPATNTLGITTAAGLDVIACGPFCSSLRSRATVSWDANGLTGGQGFRPRLAFDGGHVLNSIGLYPDDPAAWPDARQELHVTNLRRKRARRIFVGNGTSQRGFAEAPTSSRYLAYLLVHPNPDPRGDELKLIDVRPKSRNYLDIAGTAKLEQMTNGPVAGMSMEGKEQRFAALTPDGRYAFATHGGDGKVSMVNTRTRSVTQFSVPTALRGGGYVTALELGFKPVDLMGR